VGSFHVHRQSIAVTLKTQIFQVQGKCIRNANAYSTISVCSFRSKKWVLCGEHVRPSVTYQQRIKHLSNYAPKSVLKLFAKKMSPRVSFVNVCSVSVEFTCTVLPQDVLKSNNALVKSVWFKWCMVVKGYNKKTGKRLFITAWLKCPDLRSRNLVFI
jgi:hypothetical protein